MRLRLIPMVTLSVGALFVLKAGGLWMSGHFALPAIATAQAQDAGSAGTAQASQPDAGANKDAVAAGKATGTEMAAAQGADAAQGEAKAAAKDAAKGEGEAGEGKPARSREGRVINPGQDVTGAKAAILERLAERRKELDQRESELLLRENLLKAAEARVSSRIDELKEIEGKIVAVAKEREDKKKAQLKGLVTMYENMKPKDAARLFSQLSTEILVELVEQMNARKMSEILANMKDSAAERLTLAIAARGRAKAEASAPENLPKIVGDSAS